MSDAAPEEIKLDALPSSATPIAPRSTPSLSYYHLFRFATSFDWLLMIVGAIAACAAGAAMPLNTKIFGGLTNSIANFLMGKISASQLESDIDTYSLYFVALGAATLICSYIYSGTYVLAGERQARRLRETYLKAVLRQDMSWFDRQGAGEVTTRITSDTLLVQDGISEKLSFFIMNISTFVCGFIIAFTTSWQMTLVLLSVVPFLGMTVGLSNRVAAIYTKRVLDFYSTAGTIAEEALASIRTVVAFGNENRLQQRYITHLDGAEREGIKKATASGAGQGGIYLFMFCAYALGFYYGGILIVEEGALPGDVLSVFFAVLIASFSLGHSAPDLAAFGFAVGAAKALFGTIDLKSEIDVFCEDGLKLEKEEVRGEIELKQVQFTYPMRPDVPVLKSVDLKIEAGKTVALVGMSGSGKSTIIQLIERFYNPTSGEVLLDGRPVSAYNLKWLRSQVGLVSQEPVLFDATIADNVAHGLAGSAEEHLMEEEKMKRIEEACKMANAHDFIMKLPQKYQTMVGERGLLLSGGQKQRIAIARAIIKNAKVLLLDEATSALDTASERLVQDALARASVGRTCIVIAHRLSSIKDADLIVVMDKGEIVEQGTHSSLMEKCGLYHKLVEAQALRQNEENESQEEQAPDDLVLQVHSPVGSMHESMHSLPLSEIVPDVEKGIDQTPIFTSTQLWLRIAHMNTPEWLYLSSGSFAAALGGAVYPVFAIIFGSVLGVLSDVDHKKVTEGTHFWSIMFVVIAVISFFANFLQSTMFGIAGERLTTRLRGAFFRAILHQEIGFFDQKNNGTGALTARLASEAQAVQGVMGSTLGVFVNVAVTVVASITVALVYGWELTLVVISCIPILIASSMVRMKMLSGYSAKTKAAYEHSSTVACEAVSSIRTVASLTLETFVLQRFHNDLEFPAKVGHQNATFGSLVYGVSQSMNFLVNALAFYYGGRLILRREYDLERLFTVFMAIIFGSMSAGRAFAFAPDIGKAKEAGRLILGVLDRQPLINVDDPKGIKQDKTQGAVRVEDVVFRYPTRPNITVLKSISLEAQPGETIALVGHSGSGKSTIISLLERFYDPEKGSITLDGINITDWNLAALRAQIALVGQEPQLYSGTIRENIVFGYPDDPSYPPLTQQDIEAAAMDANIHSFILSLPQGYDTPLGAKGAQLSGGQKQRIAIARALVRKPKVLLLDEATSALDGESEKIVQAALDQASKNTTTIAVAHRLATIQNANRIYVFEEGCIVEFGTHDELLSKGGLYKSMVEAQNLK